MSPIQFYKYLNECIKKARHMTSSLWNFLGPRSKLSVVNKVNVYKLYSRSNLTYNIHVWYNTSKTNQQRLQTYQNKMLRLCMNLRPHPITHTQVRNTIIHEQCKMPTLKEFAEKIKNKFKEGCEDHQNIIVRTLFTHTNV